MQLPHARFLDMLTYKARLVGITVVFQEESYTSQASFLDRDPIPVYDPKRTEKPLFSGKRQYRGLYRAKDGRRIHADVNGSLNILRKAFPDSFGQGIVAPAVVVNVVKMEGCARRGKWECKEEIGSFLPCNSRACVIVLSADACKEEIGSFLPCNRLNG